MKKRQKPFYGLPSVICKDAGAAQKFQFGGLLTLSDNEDTGKIAGWATTDMIDSHGHVVAHGAFAESIAVKGISGPKGVQLLVGHDWDKPSGVITTLQYRNSGLWMEASLDLNISYARDAYFAAKARGGLSFSVGFRPSREPGDVEWIDDGDREYILIRKGDLREVSIVANPANSDAIMEWVKNDKPRPPPEQLSLSQQLEKFLKTNPSPSLVDVQSMLVQGGWVKDEATMKSVTEVFRSQAPRFFVNEPKPESVKAENVSSLQLALQKLKGALNPGQEDH